MTTATPKAIADTSPRDIARKMRDVIAENTQLTYTYLMERGSKNYDSMTMIEAFRILHTLKDIRKTVKGEEVYYSLAGMKSYVLSEEFLLSRIASKAWAEQCARWEAEGNHDPLPDVCTCVWVGNSLVPEINAEHYRKVLGKSKAEQKKYFASISS